MIPLAAAIVSSVKGDASKKPFASLKTSVESAVGLREESEQDVSEPLETYPRVFRASRGEPPPR